MGLLPTLIPSSTLAPLILPLLLKVVAFVGRLTLLRYEGRIIRLAFYCTYFIGSEGIFANFLGFLSAPISQYSLLSTVEGNGSNSATLHDSLNYWGLPSAW